MVYLSFPAGFWALIEAIAHRPFARPAAVELVPATFLVPSIPGSVQSAHPVFHRIACRPILPAAVPAGVCPSAGSIDFAPADSVVAATDSAWTAVVVFDSVAIAGSVVAADSAGFVVAAGSVV